MTTPSPSAPSISGAWRIDPARSSVEFHVRHFYGAMTVKGRFGTYEGTLDLAAQPAVQLTIDADSLDTSCASATSTCARATSSTSSTIRRSASSPTAPSWTETG